MITITKLIAINFIQKIIFIKIEYFFLDSQKNKYGLNIFIIKFNKT